MSQSYLYELSNKQRRRQGGASWPIQNSVLVSPSGYLRVTLSVKQGGSRFRYGDRIAKFIRALLISEDGWGKGGEGRRTLGARLARKASFIGDASSNFEQTCGHVGSRTTLENYPSPFSPLHEKIVRSSILHTWDAISTCSIASRFLHSIIFKEVR